MKTYYAILTLTIFTLLNPLATGVIFSNMSNITNNTLNDTININTSNFTILPMNNSTILNISSNRTPLNYEGNLLNTSNITEEHKKENISYINYSILNTSKINDSYLKNTSNRKHYNTTEYLNISIKGYKVIIETDGEPMAYVNNTTLILRK